MKWDNLKAQFIKTMSLMTIVISLMLLQSY